MREYGSEHPAIVLPDGYFEKLSDLGREITYLRSGREALMLTALASREGTDDVILFPAYCCWSMSAPFEKVGWTVVYYRLNEDLTVDLDYLEGLLNERHPKAVLTMNFYGSTSTRKAVEMAHRQGVTVIEDFSHCTFCLRDIFDENVDYYVSSIRKSVGVSDGAIILSKEAMPMEYVQGEVKEFSDRRVVAQKMKGRYGYDKNQEDKQFFLGEIRCCEGLLDEFDAVRPISDLARKQIAQLNGEEIAYARRENMRHLWSKFHELEVLIGSEKFRMVPGLERSFEGAPFSLPILVENRDEVQGALAKRGVYTQWLWPLCEEALSICPVSRTMNDKMLSVPVDQRFSWDDIEEMANILLDAIK